MLEWVLAKSGSWGEPSTQSDRVGKQESYSFDVHAVD
jgi:hypothetical protein